MQYQVELPAITNDVYGTATLGTVPDDKRLLPDVLESPRRDIASVTGGEVARIYRPLGAGHSLLLSFTDSFPTMVIRAASWDETKR
jgi:hypothetical protein